MRRVLTSMILAFCVLAPVARAGSYCSEHVTMVIVQGDSIFFETDKSCQSWCEINTAWSTTAQDRAYTTLVVAHTTGESVWFYWSDMASWCSATEATYSIPGSLILSN